jgi:hypothetical protein
LNQITLLALDIACCTYMICGVNNCVGNSLFFSQQRFESSYLGNLTRPQPEAKEASKHKELSNDPKAVIREFESQPSLHTNSLAFSEYIKALAKVDGVGESESLKTLQRGDYLIRIAHFLLILQAF